MKEKKKRVVYFFFPPLLCYDCNVFAFIFDIKKLCFVRYDIQLTLSKAHCIGGVDGACWKSIVLYNTTLIIDSQGSHE